MKTKLLLLCCGAFALALPHPVLAIEDTPENRAKEADRYFEAAAPKEMLDEMTTQMAAAVPDAEKAKFKELLTKHFNYESFVKSMKDAMVRHFTATELGALADFYSSDVGKSAMKKMGGYTAEIMPLVQTEILKAQQRALNEQGGLPAMPPGIPSKDGVASSTPAPAPAPASQPQPGASATAPAPAPAAPATASAPAPSPAAPGFPPVQATPGQTLTPGFPPVQAGPGQPSAPAQPGQPAQPQAQPQPQPFPAAPGRMGGIPTSPPEVISATKG